MTTPQPTTYGKAKWLVAQPGNGTRYLIAYNSGSDGTSFVALPDFQRANQMDPFPVEWRYIAEKLDLHEEDARAVWAALQEVQHAEVAHDVEVTRSLRRGPNHRFQMYSREGNDALAQAVQATVANHQANPEQTRETLLGVLRSNLRLVSRAGHREWQDTEPQWAIVDEMNAYLATTGIRDITRDDLS